MRACVHVWSFSLSLIESLQIYIFVLICSYISSMQYSVVDTLANPILGDHFGFSVKDEYYVVVGISVCLFISSCLL